MSTAVDTSTRAGLVALADQLADQVGRTAEVDGDAVEFTPPLEDFLAAGTPLLVVGGPGSGKSLLSVRYQYEVLRRRGAGEPVPVVFRLDTWHAGTGVREWVERRLAAEWPVGRAAASALVDAGLVHVIVDGVDRLAAGLRTRFVTEVRELAVPVLLTSRPIDVDGAMPTLTLDPPPLHALLRRWPRIADEVRANPSGPLATALSDLVIRFVFVQTYSKPGADPSGLLDPSAFDDVAKVEEHLLDEPAGEVRSWLRGMAHWARTTGESGIAWWRLPEPVPRSAWVVLALLTGGFVAYPVSGWGTVLDQSSPEDLHGLYRVLIGVLIAVVVAAVVHRPEPTLLPVKYDPSAVRPRGWLWLAGGGLGGLVAAGSWVWLNGDLPTALSILTACIGGGALMWLRGKVVVVEEDHMDSPRTVVRQDAAVALVRLACGLGLTIGVTAIISASSRASVHFDEQLPQLFAALVLSGAAWSASVRCLVASLLPRSGSLLFSLTVLGPAAPLLHREGGVYRFQDDSVPRTLTKARFEQIGLGTARTTARQISAMRYDLADHACRRMGVPGVLDGDRLREFVDGVAADIDMHVDALVAATAGVRRQYLAARDRYRGRAVPRPWDSAVDLVEMSGSISVLGIVAIVLAAEITTWRASGLVSVEMASLLCAVVIVVVVSWWVPGGRPGNPYRGVGHLVFGLVTAGSLTFLAGLLSTVEDVSPAVVAIGAVSGVVALCFALLGARLRKLVTALSVDDPAKWPVPKTRQLRDLRQRAVRAHEAWVHALVEVGVRQLVAARLTGVGRSYRTTMPPADAVPGLGDVTEVAQYVPTDTMHRLAHTMDSLTRGAIGICGPRGVGKSTVLRMIGKLGFGARLDDRALLVSAPTNYDSREFLVHLYAKLCTSVLDVDDEPPPRWWRWRPLLLTPVGLLIALCAWQWPWLVGAAGWVPPNWRGLAVAGGLLLAVIPVWVLRRRWQDRGGFDDHVKREARRRLEGLRLVDTTTVTRTAAVKPPGGAEFGGSHALARAGRAKTLPELVDEFEAFLRLLTDQKSARRAGAGSPDETAAADRTRGRIVVCIDELDKIGSAAEAERFLNDIKAIFGSTRCFFLVTVSDDALASFSGRSLTVRTAFDSAFDSVVRVRRFTLADTRLLLMQRSAKLPEPFVWLCHALSGGLPRDLNRVAYELYYLLDKEDKRRLADVARALVAADLEAVCESLAARLTDRFEAFAMRLRQHIVNAPRVEVDSAALRGYRLAGPQPGGTSEDLMLVNEQFRVYLQYAEAVVRTFCERGDEVVARLAGTDATEVESLALTRTWLAADPVTATAHLRTWHGFEDAFPVTSR
ncbi:hypothetical protein [Saccharothrix stipae]